MVVVSVVVVVLINFISLLSARRRVLLTLRHLLGTSTRKLCGSSMSKLVPCALSFTYAKSCPSLRPALPRDRRGSLDWSTSFDAVLRISASSFCVAMSCTSDDVIPLPVWRPLSSLDVRRRLTLSTGAVCSALVNCRGPSLSDQLTRCDADGRQVTLLDVSPAFDCVDHDLLFQRFDRHDGLRGDVVRWTSFVTGRTSCCVWLLPASAALATTKSYQHRDICR